jgi:lysophospholipase L1-like esterase
MFMPEIINAGVGGNNSRALLARLEEDVLSRDPSLVIVMVGTNDALNSEALVPLDEYRENLDSLVARCIASGCRVLLATIIPFHEPALMTRHQAAAYGEMPPARRHTAVINAIRDCSREHSLPLAEVNSVFTALGNTGEDASSLLRNPANSGVVDGVHPTAQGYALIATIIFQTILDHRLPTSRVVCLGDSITMGIAMQGEGTATGDTYPGRLAAMLSAMENGADCAFPKEHKEVFRV